MLIVALRAFYDRGDLNVRHNLPGRPATDILLAALFTAGWLAALWRIREPRCRLLLIWFGVMLAPTVFSIEAPHSLRASGVLPPFALLCGLGAVTLIALLPRASWRRVAAPALLLAVLLVSGSLTARDYFVRWAQSGSLGAAFSLQEQLAAEAAAKFLDSAAPDSGLLVSARLFSQPQAVFALGMLPQSTLGATLPVTSTDKVDFLLENHFDPRQPMYLLTKVNGAAPVTPVEPLPDSRCRRAASPLRPGPVRSHAGRGRPTAPLGHGLPGRPARRFPAPRTRDRQPPRCHVCQWRPAHRLRRRAAAGGSNPRAYASRSSGSYPIRAKRPMTEWVFLNLADDQGVWWTQNGPLSESYLLPWLHGDLQIQDVRVMPVPEEMPAGKAWFEAGLYEADFAKPKQAGPRVGIVDGEGRVAADQVDLAAVMVRAEPPQADMAGLQDLAATFDGPHLAAGLVRGPRPAGSRQAACRPRLARGSPLDDRLHRLHPPDRPGRTDRRAKRPAPWRR